VLAGGLFIAIEGVERLSAKVVQLGIGLVPLEVVGLLQRLGRVLELARRRRGAPGIALGRAVVRQRPQDLFELAERAFEIAARQRLLRLLALLFDLLRLLGREPRLAPVEPILFLRGRRRDEHQVKDAGHEHGGRRTTHQSCPPSAGGRHGAGSCNRRARAGRLLFPGHSHG
jgi:hypothetical protein